MATKHDGVCGGSDNTADVVSDDIPSYSGPSTVRTLGTKTAVEHLQSRKEQCEPLERYTMNNSVKSRAVIFKSTRLTKMDKANENITNLQECLSKFAFYTECIDFATKGDVAKELDKISEWGFKEFDCFMCILVFHADDNHMFTKDGIVDIEKLVDKFKGDHCKSLVDKPKIFLIQVCREKPPSISKAMRDKLVVSTKGGDLPVFPTKTKSIIAAGADFLIACSPLPDFSSSDYVELDTCYIETLTKAMTKYGAGIEFTQILTLVNREVTEANRKVAEKTEHLKKMPYFSSTLTKQLVFTPDTRPPELHLEAFRDKEFPRYKMDHPDRGFAVIFNHKKVEKDNRKGSDKDAVDLGDCLKDQGFTVLICQDFTAEEVSQTLKTMSKYDHKGYDCFICVCLSHGDDGIIYASDGKKVVLQEIFGYFKGHQSFLHGKPKIFLFQACRGKHDEIGVINERQQSTSGKSPSNQSSGAESELIEGEVLPPIPEVLPPIPDEEDFLLAFPCSKGTPAFRYPITGSQFIQALVEAMTSHGTGNEFTQILSAVNRDVGNTLEGYDCLQMPCFVSSLTKKLEFAQKSKEGTMKLIVKLNSKEAPEIGKLISVTPYFNSQVFSYKENSQERKMKFLFFRENSRKKVAVIDVTKNTNTATSGIWQEAYNELGKQKAKKIEDFRDLFGNKTTFSNNLKGLIFSPLGK